MKTSVKPEPLSVLIIKQNVNKIQTLAKRVDTRTFELIHKLLDSRLINP